ncbi:hypothetical protein GCM10010168_45890 [Actinoplanes ianthinogenes]|nr:hypothetical protein GCM10010168_45890 [Actinoplanes ianthinogenes]
MGRYGGAVGGGIGGIGVKRVVGASGDPARLASPHTKQVRPAGSLCVAQATQVQADISDCPGV